MPGVDVNQVSGRTGTALHAAAREKSDDGTGILELLLAAGADPNLRAGKFGSALTAAASHGRLENLRFLLARGARLDVADDDTPDAEIHGTAANDCESGADRRKFGSPLEAAMGKHKYHHIANFLKRYTPP